MLSRPGPRHCKMVCEFPLEFCSSITSREPCSCLVLVFPGQRPEHINLLLCAFGPTTHGTHHSHFRGVLQVYMKEKTTTCTQRVNTRHPRNNRTDVPDFPSSTSHDLVHHKFWQRKHAIIELCFRVLLSAALPGHGKAEGEFTRTSAIWMCDEEEKNSRGGNASIYTHCTKTTCTSSSLLFRYI